MSKQSEMKPGKNGYKIYFNTNTVVMNYKFAELAESMERRNTEL